jgi:hypothetical protein
LPALYLWGWQCCIKLQVFCTVLLLQMADNGAQLEIQNGNDQSFKKEAGMSNNTDQNTHTENQDQYDAENCQAQPMAGSRNYELVECLVHGKLSCAHMLMFGYRCLCRHPNRREIVERTDIFL